MSGQSGYQVSATAAEMYERYAGLYMGPWVPDFVALAGLQRGERVLDLACGTGIVARQAALEVGAAGRVTGLDFNAGMLAVARATPAPRGASTDWIEGSAVAMKFPDASFDAVLCQQGLQFFPDRLAALRESLRVLAPGGRALFSVWRSPSPYNVAAGDALQRFAGRDVAIKYGAARRQLPDAGELRRMLVEAGFQSVEVRPRTIIVRLPSIETFVIGHLSSSPVSGAVSSLDPEQQAEFGRQVRAALQPYAEGDGVAIPDEINIAIGRKP